MTVKRVRENYKMTEWFVKEMVVNKRCAMSPCLLNVSIHGMFRKMKV